LRRLTIALVLWLGCPVVAQVQAGPTPDVTALARSVDAHYNHLHTLKTEFTEFYRGSGMERTESGTLWLKKPGKMRWEYRSPREKVFVSDGSSVWLAVKGDRQVRKTAAKKLDDARSPLAFLLGKLKLEKELQALSLATDLKPLTAGDTLLRGVPRAMQDRVSGVLVEVTPQLQIARIVWEEPDGSSTEFRFEQQGENTDVPDSRFKFEPPAGAEVVEDGFGP